MPRSYIGSGLWRIAQCTPAFSGKYRLFRALYRLCGVPEDRWFRVPMRGTRTLVHVSLGSLLESKVLCQGDYEPKLSSTIDRLVCPGWNCMDIGANVGLVTVRIAERAGPTGRVLAIEPNPALLPRLAANTQLLSNVTRIGMAVGATSGEGLLAVNDPTVCANHNATMVGARVESGAIRVPVTTLDSLWREVLHQAPVRFLKLDIEGYEFEALRGARRLLAAARPAILMEFNKHYADALAYSLGDVLGYLRQFGPYRMLWMGAGRPHPVQTTPALVDVLFQTDTTPGLCS
jgi:FkbM family methyltransferase